MQSLQQRQFQKGQSLRVWQPPQPPGLLRLKVHPEVHERGLQLSKHPLPARGEQKLFLFQCFILRSEWRIKSYEKFDQISTFVVVHKLRAAASSA